MEGVAGDRCALDGSPCVNAGRINSAATGEQNEGYAFEREGNAPGVWVPLRWIVYDWLRGKKL